MIPNFKEMMFPILGFLADNKIHNKKEIDDFIAEHFKMSEEDKSAIYEKTKVSIWRDKTHWALSYIAALGKNKPEEIQKLNLIDRVERAKYKINALGLQAAKSEVDFAKWCEKVHGKNFLSNLNSQSARNSNLKAQKASFNDNTPDENLYSNLSELENAIKSELLDLILSKEPRFFENLALRLLEKIGYGVRRGELTQNGADGGIDGVVDEDALGFSKIYIQAKRFNKDAVVGRPEIQKFVGALATKPTKKGLFITTSSFSSDARGYAVGSHDYSIVLIDGERLLDLMLRYKLGVQVKEIKEIYAVDGDFFDDENY